MREELLKIAMRFQIESDLGFDGAVSIADVLKVLNNVYRSYQNFIEIEFFKNENLTKAYHKNDSVLKTIKKDLDLLVVDLKYGSFDTALAPVINNNGSTLFKDEINEWKNKSYSYYKDNIFTGDFDNLKYIKGLEHLYSEDERAKIFAPLFSSVREAKHYKVNIKNSEGNVQKRLVLPEESIISFYTPKIERPKEKDYKTIQAYMQVAKEGDGYDLKKGNIKKIYYLEELEHDTYPYKPDIIKFDNIIYNLKEKLDCNVAFEDDNYILTNELFDITVWGDTREEAENAFCFTFSALYQNFAKESDDKLTEEAKTIKERLLQLVKGEYSDEN